MLSVRYVCGLVGVVLLAGCASGPPGYRVSDNAVTYKFYIPFSSSVRTVQGADPATFEALPGAPLIVHGSGPYLYGRDATSIYFRHMPMPGADRDTFRVFEHGYAVDARNAYYRGRRISASDAIGEDEIGLETPGRVVDPATFEVLSEDLSRDARGILYVTLDRMSVRAVDACDPASFDRSFGVQQNYWRDGECVYFESQRLDGADPATLRVLPRADYSPDHAADAKSVYVRDQRIDGADPATFEVLPYDYGRDAERVYFSAFEYNDETRRYDVRRLGAIDADPATFEAPIPTYFEIYMTSFKGSPSYDARDARACFMEGEPVVCSD